VAPIFGIRTPISESIKFVQSCCHRVSTQILPGDFLLADEFGFGPLKLALGQSAQAQGLGFFEQLDLDNSYLLRGRPRVEGKIPWAQAKEVLRTHVVSQAQALSNAEKET